MSAGSARKEDYPWMCCLGRYQGYMSRQEFSFQDMDSIDKFELSFRATLGLVSGPSDWDRILLERDRTCPLLAG